MIFCTKCDFKADANPKDTKEDYNSKGMFLRKYGISYKAVLLMQHLGMGLEGLGQILSFLGIAAGTGNKKKWKDIQNLLGKAQQKVYNEVIEDNIAEEIVQTKEAVEKK
jgi:hypothetical protein